MVKIWLKQKNSRKSNTFQLTVTVSNSLLHHNDCFLTIRSHCCKSDMKFYHPSSSWREYWYSMSDMAMSSLWEVTTSPVWPRTSAVLHEAVWNFIVEYVTHSSHLIGLWQTKECCDWLRGSVCRSGCHVKLGSGRHLILMTWSVSLLMICRPPELRMQASITYAGIYLST